MAKFLRISNGVPRMFEEFSSVSIYDQIIAYVSTVTTGTAVTLPLSQTYTSGELEVYLNGVRLESVFDYNYISSPPRTQVSFTFDLISGDELRFRIDRSA